MKKRIKILSVIFLIMNVFVIFSNFTQRAFAVDGLQTTNYKITVVGSGYVGLANAVLLAQNNEVCLLDIIPQKIDMVNNKQAPFVDKEISEFLKTKKLNLTATMDEIAAYKNSDYIVIATPTDYDPDKNFFNTSSIETVIEHALKINPQATIVIKSTIPIRYTESIRKKYGCENIIFSPEFLREGKALYDNLYPSRIIIGSDLNDEKLTRSAKIFADLLVKGAQKEDIPILLTNFTEAEAIKLFANGYLALRVAYFNELDTYCEVNSLNSKQIIDGVCLDPRIGSHYNNPSFGYGGYCFPKDTKQLRANFKDTPNNVIDAIITSNDTRKKFIADSIARKNPDVVGIYRLSMKSGSDNFRQSAIIDIMKMLGELNIKVVIYEPTAKSDKFLDYKVINDLNEFKRISNIIVANRYNEELNDVQDKVYTKDVYLRD